MEPLNTKVYDLLVKAGATPEQIDLSSAHAYNELLDYGLEGVSFETYYAVVLHSGPTDPAFDEIKQAMGAAAKRAMSDPASPTYLGHLGQ